MNQTLQKQIRLIRKSITNFPKIRAGKIIALKKEGLGE